MNRTVIRATICLCAFAVLGSPVGRADDDVTTKELKRLEGVWASTPPKAGRGRGHVLTFQGGKLLWESFQTMDGKPLIGHTKLFDIEIIVTASSHKITATRGDAGDRETRQGVYELDGDSLKVAFGSDQGILLRREKGAKVPDLVKASRPKKTTSIQPRSTWQGRLDGSAVQKKCPETPITTPAEFEAVWKALRGAEKLPAVDFAKEFVLVQTTTYGKLTEIEVVIIEGEREAEVTGAAEVRREDKPGGLAYIIGVFRRELVDVAEGRIVVKDQKR